MHFLSLKERKKERKCPIESGGMKFLIGLLPKVPFQLEILPSPNLLANRLTLECKLLTNVDPSYSH
jgi:hypothetical protein